MRAASPPNSTARPWTAASAFARLRENRESALGIDRNRHRDDDAFAREGFADHTIFAFAPARMRRRNKNSTTAAASLSLGQIEIEALAWVLAIADIALTR